MVKSITIDKFKNVSKMEFMDLVIYKGNRLVRKKFVPYQYAKSLRLHSAKGTKKTPNQNYVLNELKWYVENNSENSFTEDCKIKFSTYLKTKVSESIHCQNCQI